MIDVKKLFVKSFIALSLISLYGCDNSPDQDNYSDEMAKQDEDNFVNSVSKSQTFENINKECQELVPYLSKMREQDPSVMEIYYGINEKDGKTKELHIVRADSEITNVSSATCDKYGVAYVSENNNNTNVYASNSQTHRLVNSSSLNSDNNEEIFKNNTASGNINNEGHIPDVQTQSDNHVQNQVKSNPTFTDHVFLLAGGMAAGYMLSQYVNAGRGNGMNYLSNNYQNTSYQNLDDQERRKRRGVITSAYIGNISKNNKIALREGIKTGQVKMPTTSRSYQSRTLSTRSSGFFKSSGGARSGGYSGGG